MIVDDTVINWCVATAAVVIPSIGAGVVVLWRKLIAYIQPKITAAFTAHTELVEEMKVNVPVVANTMASMAVTMRTLGDAQRGQSEILAQHTVLHEETGSKLDQLLIEINAVKHTCP